MICVNSQYLMADTPALMRRTAQRVRMGWIRGSLAMTAEGDLVGERNEKAAYWCSIGALGREIEGVCRLGQEAAVAIVFFAYLSTPGLEGARTLVFWNDHCARDAEHVASTFERLADLLDRVRALPEKAPQVLSQTWVVTKQEPAELVTA